jgi:hypothetical protein
LDVGRRASLQGRDELGYGLSGETTKTACRWPRGHAAKDPRDERGFIALSNGSFALSGKYRLSKSYINGRDTPRGRKSTSYPAKSTNTSSTNPTIGKDQVCLFLSVFSFTHL